jgi:hypothetical protein
VDGQAGRGSDDDYCSAYPSDGHHYISHSVRAEPIAWVERCHLCGHISSKVLREQLVGPIEGGRERVYLMPLLTTPTLQGELAEARRIAADIPTEHHAQ